LFAERQEIVGKERPGPAVVGEIAARPF